MGFNFPYVSLYSRLNIPGIILYTGLSIYMVLSSSTSTTTTIDGEEQKGILYSNFVDSIKSQATRKQYIYGLSRYMKYYNFKDVKDLVKESDKSIKLIEANIIQFIMWLKQTEKISSFTIRVYLSAIMHFYYMNDVVLNKKKIAMYLGEPVKKQKDRAYATEEIHKLLEFCDERAKAIVLLLASTGIRIGAIPDLQLKHLSKIADGYQLYKIIIYEGTNAEYFTFTTPEAAGAIDNYLGFRGRCGEKLSPDSPLFREQFDINDMFCIKHPKKIKLRSVCKILEEKLHRSGIMLSGRLVEGQKHGVKRNPVPRAHGFRKFATTNMIRAKLNPEAREMLLGHSIGLSNSYYRPDANEILQEYLKAVDLLTINEENRLRLKVETLEIRKDKIDELQQTIADVKAQLGIQ
jgi:integrase